MTKLIQTPEIEIPLSFPRAGIDRFRSFMNQQPRKMPSEEYGATTPEGVNVRGFESSSRGRGGSRPGLAKYVPAALDAGWLVQDLQQLTYEGTPSGAMQTSSSGRIVYLTAISKGVVYYTTAGQKTRTAATNNTGNTPPLNFTGIIQSSVNNLKMYFADGTNWVYFDPSDTSVNTLTASAGSLPIDSAGNKPRLTATWRGSTVWGGLLLDPQNWFISKQGDATNYNYGSTSPSSTDAVAGNNSPLGLIGDAVTGICPYTDDILIFGGDHTIWMMRGHPLAGGSLDLITDQCGFAWGKAFCKAPDGSVYFCSNQMGIYQFVPGHSFPQRVSHGIEQLLQDVNSGTNTITMAWNDRYQGLHVFITPTANAAASKNMTHKHLFYEARTGAWWQDSFANYRHNPLCTLTYDGNLPTDRVTLIGSWDGYVRSISSDATTDDGYPIESSVTLGPILTKDLDDVKWKEIKAVLGEESGDVGFAVHVGTSAEKALDSAPVRTGTWSAGRNFTHSVNRSGHACYVKLTATTPWAYEACKAVVELTGQVRRRG